jgi:hypothetical protein
MGWHRDYAICWMAEEVWFDPRLGQKIFQFTTASKQLSEEHTSNMKMMLWNIWRSKNEEIMFLKRIITEEEI